MRLKTLCASALFLAASIVALPAQAQIILTGPAAELVFVRGPNYPENPEDSTVGLLGGWYVGTSGLELRTSALLAEGAYQGALLDAGVRVTPKWFGQQEYLFGIVSPYAVLGGSVSYPWGLGYHAKAGLGVAVMQYGSVNAEIGYRYHPLTPEQLIEGVSLGLRATFPF